MGNDLAELLEPTELGDSEDVSTVEAEAEGQKLPETSEEETRDGADGKAKEETTNVAEEKPTLNLSLEEQNRELRQILRAQKRDIQIMQAKLERVEKRSVVATKKVEQETDDYGSLFGTEGKNEEAVVPDELSPIEIATRELSTIAQVKGPILETLIEVMEMSPKYQDVRDVCSQSNFQDMFDTVGEAIAAKEGKDASLAALEVEAAVWKMANPYKYMYDLIRQYHPKYAGKEEKKEAVPGVKTTATAPKQTPTSLANVPGKTAGTNKWTSARINELDEMELDSVPPDIYDKYLRGELE